MRTKLVTRYYCDHCSRGSLTKSSMVAHESRCFRNPNRKCELCVEVVECSATELNAAFAEGGLPLLREKAHGCPACILSALMQGSAGDSEDWHDFDYKKEKEAWDKEQNDLRWEGVAF